MLPFFFMCIPVWRLGCGLHLAFGWRSESAARWQLTDGRRQQIHIISHQMFNNISNMNPTIFPKRAWEESLLITMSQKRSCFRFRYGAWFDSINRLVMLPCLIIMNSHQVHIKTFFLQLVHSLGVFWKRTIIQPPSSIPMAMPKVGKFNFTLN